MTNLCSFTPTHPPTAVAVEVAGPEAYAGPETDFDEVPEWTVCMVDTDGDPIGKVYYVRSYEKAMSLGKRMASDRRLEFANEAMPA